MWYARRHARKKQELNTRKRASLSPFELLWNQNQLPEPATSPLNPEPLARQERSAASATETSVKTEEEAAGAEEEEEEEEDEEEDEEEEVGAAGTEPKLSKEERVKTRRADTIKAKALEITKVARDPLQENHP